MEELIIIILTSTVVSGLVTVITGHFFESRRFIKNKKLEVYSEFVNKLNELLYPRADGLDLRTRFYRCLADLEKVSWNVVLFSRDKDLKNISQTIVNNYRKLLNASHNKQNLTELERKKLENLNKEQAKNKDKFMKLANSDINSWF